MYPNSLNGLANMGPRPMQPPGGVVPPHMQPMGQPRPASQMGGAMQGYLASGGPAIGSDPWKAQRAEGNHPFLDWFRSQHPQGGWNMGGQGNATPGNMQPWGQPRQAQTSYQPWANQGAWR